MKKNKIIIIILSLLVVLLFGGILYLLKYNNRTIKYDDDYLLLDISKRDKFETKSTIKKESVIDFQILNNLNVSYDENYNKGFFKLDNTTEYIDVDNVKKIYALHCGCTSSCFEIYLLTDNGDVYTISEDTLNNFYADNEKGDLNDDMLFNYIKLFSNSFVKINKNISYNNLGTVYYQIGSTCGSIHSIIGFDETNTPYEIESENKFIDKYSYYIGMDGQYAIDSQGDLYKLNHDKKDDKLNIKIKNVIYNSYVYSILISEDNKLYLFGDENFNNGDLVKVNDYEIAKIKYKNIDTDSKEFKVIFKDNSEIVLNTK